MGKVIYNQKGYVGCSMSVNATLAYLSGEKPRSKWTKAAMLGSIARYCESSGLDYDGSASQMTKDEVFSRFFERKGWHHTGKYANATDFYGLNEDAVFETFGGR